VVLRSLPGLLYLKRLLVLQRLYWLQVRQVRWLTPQ
jgi:hypothetical protein